MSEKSEQEFQGSRKLGIYLLPNLFTTASLFSGFYAVVAAMQQMFDAAALAIILALILDSLDGRVARLINAQSTFGGHYDSISDMVAFGVSPALVLYNWSLHHLYNVGLGKIGWLSAFIYVACVALRLAKFNSISQDTPASKRYFFGLPCPAAAAFVASGIWFCNTFGISGESLKYILPAVTVVLGILMVSNIYYRSFKDVDLKDRIRFSFAFSIVVIIAAIALLPKVAIFVLVLGYIFSGPVGVVYRRHDRIFKSLRRK